MILAIQLDRASREPLYRQIESQLRASIQDGRLRPGALLPGVRTLAGQLGVARITIVTAYEQLTSEGLLEARVGSGTRVAVDAAASGRPHDRTSTSTPRRVVLAPDPPARRERLLRVPQRSTCGRVAFPLTLRQRPRGSRRCARPGASLRRGAASTRPVRPNEIPPATPHSAR